MTVGGYGLVPYGRAEVGHAKSSIEPRFYESSPADGATGISVYQTTINFRIYGFSSRVQLDDELLVEISEDAGERRRVYADAYASGAFVAPYNGSNSKIDAHQAEPSVFRVTIEKTDLWTDDRNISIRVTAKDEYGQETTKEVPVVWE